MEIGITEAWNTEHLQQIDLKRKTIHRFSIYIEKYSLNAFLGKTL